MTTYPNPIVPIITSRNNVTVGSYGSSNTSIALTVNAQGQITTISSTSIAISGSQITSGTLGSGSVVLSNGASLTNANLNTPSAINLANATNVPLGQASGNLAVANLASGTGASSSTFWRGDGSWSSTLSNGLTAGDPSGTHDSSSALSVYGRWQGSLDVSNQTPTATSVTSPIAGTLYIPGAVIKMIDNSSMVFRKLVSNTSQNYYALDFNLNGAQVVELQNNNGSINVTFAGGINANNLATATPLYYLGIDSGGNFIKTSSGGGGGGGGSVPSRNSASATTTSLANNATDSTQTISGYKGYALYSIQTSAAAWVRVYSSTAARTADSGRSSGSDPAPGSGVLAEVITSGASTQLITPGVIGFSSESSPNGNIPISVTNLSGSTTGITVTLTLVQLES